MRVHSQCLTGDVFGSLRCDCGAAAAPGDARGAGRAAGASCSTSARRAAASASANKLRAYALQDGGLDTVEANVHLGFPADQREYGIGAQILHDLGVRRLRLLTNNPKKLDRPARATASRSSSRCRCAIEPNPHNQRYLETKREKLGHLLDEPE